MHSRKSLTSNYDEFQHINSSFINQNKDISKVKKITFPRYEKTRKATYKNCKVSIIRRI